MQSNQVGAADAMVISGCIFSIPLRIDASLRFFAIPYVFLCLTNAVDQFVKSHQSVIVMLCRLIMICLVINLVDYGFKAVSGVTV